MTKKFRIWSPYHQKFVIEGAEFGLERLFESIYIKIKGTWNRNRDYKTPTNVNSYVVQQWTGLTDSQGVEIYEGDILFHKNEKQRIKIKFHDGAFCFFGKNHPENGFVLTSSYKDEVSVIGNIFQNPELLEKC